MQVMLLAAGKSTRLGALGATRPKPLVPVCGHPPLAFGLALCRAAVLTRVVINLHHHAEQIRAAFGDGRDHGVSIRYSLEEPEILGTGGGLVHARPLFAPGPLLVVNGKVVADVDLDGVVAFHRRQPPGTVATMVVRRTPDAAKFAPVEVDGTGRVVGLRGERGATHAGPVSPFMFTGIHVLEPALLDRLPKEGPSDVIASAYLPALRAGERVAAVECTGYFEEHSTPRDYLNGNLALLRAPHLVPHPPGPLVGVDLQARVSAQATIVMPVRIDAGAVIEAGATVGPEVVVGAGVTIAAGARLERVVVWDGARVGATDGVLADAVITSADTVVDC